MSNSTTTSSSRGKNCGGTIVFTPQVNDLISGPNPDIVKAANMLQHDANENLAPTLKGKIVRLLELRGINTLPKKGIDAITFEPKNVRYKFSSDDDHRSGWQFRCGNDSFDWYYECKLARCMGITHIKNLNDLFGRLFKAVRAPVGSPESDLKEVLDMCDSCGYGHPAACGEMQFAEIRVEFLMSILKDCKFGKKCNSSEECSMIHDTTEKNKIRTRLEDYVKTLQKKVSHETKWGANENALSLDEVVVAATAPKATSFPPLASSGTWKAPVLLNKSKAVVIATPPVLSVAVSAPSQAVVKSYVDDDSLTIEEVHKKYIADLRARSAREKVKKTEHTKEIARLNKEIETRRAEMERLENDAGKVDKLIGIMSSVNDPTLKSIESAKVLSKISETQSKTSSSEFKSATVPVVEKKANSNKKKSISSLSSSVPVQIAAPHSLPELADSDSVVDVSNDEDDDDPLNGRLVILEPINAQE